MAIHSIDEVLKTYALAIAVAMQDIGLGESEVTLILDAAEKTLEVFKFSDDKEEPVTQTNPTFVQTVDSLQNAIFTFVIHLVYQNSLEKSIDPYESRNNTIEYLEKIVHGLRIINEEYDELKQKGHDIIHDSPWKET